MWIDIVINLAVIAMVTATSVPLGRYVWKVFTDQWTWLDPVLTPVERLVLRATGVSTTQQDWRAYCVSLVASNVVMWVAAYLLLVSQSALPLNPDGIASMEPTLAFNTAVSFTTNTNLQHYGGETGLSTLAQLLVIVWLQFVTPATGIAACIAVCRGLAGSRLKTLGNFYRDCTRASVRVLLPLALPVALILVWQGVPATYGGTVTALAVDGGVQTIARGMVAPEVAIKQLGTNGGGYFGPNSTHPFENPTPLSNLVQTWSIAVVPMALVWTLGHFLRRRPLAVMLFTSMLAIYVPMVIGATVAEGAAGGPLTALGVDASHGSLEGKEVRIGTGLSALWAVTTTVTSNGSVNAMHDSMTPIGGLMPLAGMWLNNVFGGVGVGLINMMLYLIVTVFVAGMMVGRTPEFLGKKVEAREMKLASLALLWHPLAILVATAMACLVWVQTPDPGTALGWLKNPGAHGFSEMLYEFTSAAANNGSGFEGLSDNTPFWNIATGLGMLLSRYIPIVAPVALVASLAAKPASDESAGSLRADSATFGVMLWGVTIIIGLLMFLPVAVLGPIADHLSLGVGR